MTRYDGANKTEEYMRVTIIALLIILCAGCTTHRPKVCYGVLRIYPEGAEPKVMTADELQATIAEYRENGQWPK